jgi:hypothetical protein
MAQCASLDTGSTGTAGRKASIGDEGKHRRACPVVRQRLLEPSAAHCAIRRAIRPGLTSSAKKRQVPVPAANQVDPPAPFDPDSGWPAICPESMPIGTSATY